MCEWRGKRRTKWGCSHGSLRHRGTWARNSGQQCQRYKEVDEHEGGAETLGSCSKAVSRDLGEVSFDGMPRLQGIKARVGGEEIKTAGVHSILWGICRCRSWSERMEERLRPVEKTWGAKHRSEYLYNLCQYLQSIFLVGIQNKLEGLIPLRVDIVIDMLRFLSTVGGCWDEQLNVGIRCVDCNKTKGTQRVRQSVWGKSSYGGQWLFTVFLSNILNTRLRFDYFAEQRSGLVYLFQLQARTI